MPDLTHFDSTGAARMVDVGSKPESERAAWASAMVQMSSATTELIRSGQAKKGDVLAVARLAGMQAAKRTGELIPLCHPLPLTAVSIDFAWVGATSLRINARVKTFGRTGVEMEALTAVSVAGLTVYDMVKSVDRTVQIDAVRLEEKSGGTRGPWSRSA